MDIMCVHCAKTINAAASICPWCHKPPLGDGMPLTAGQRILWVGNLLKMLSVLILFGAGIYFAVKVLW
jgi:hypothetical protein